MFGDPAAVVDGNVIRVVSRLRALSGDPTKLGALHTAIAQEMLDSGRPGCFNQVRVRPGDHVGHVEHVGLGIMWAMWTMWAWESCAPCGHATHMVRGFFHGVWDMWDCCQAW